MSKSVSIADAGARSAPINNTLDMSNNTAAANNDSTTNSGDGNLSPKGGLGGKTKSLLGRAGFSLKSVASNVMSGQTAYAEESRLKEVKDAIRLAVGDGVRLLSELNLAENSMIHSTGAGLTNNSFQLNHAADSEKQIISQVENSIFAIVRREVQSTTDLQNRLRKAENRMDFMQQQLEKRGLMATEQREELLKELAAQGENHRHWHGKYLELLEQYKQIQAKIRIYQTSSAALGSSASFAAGSMVFSPPTPDATAGGRRSTSSPGISNELSQLLQADDLNDTLQRGTTSPQFADAPAVGERMAEEWAQMLKEEEMTERQKKEAQDQEQRIKGLQLKLRQEQQMNNNRSNKKMEDLIKLETTKLENRCRQLEMQLRRKEVEMEKTTSAEREKWKTLHTNATDSQKVVNKQITLSTSKKVESARMELADLESRFSAELKVMKDARDQARNAVGALSRENDHLKKDLEKLKSGKGSAASGDIKSKEMSKAYERTAKQMQQQLAAKEVEMDNLKEDHKAAMEALTKEKQSVQADLMIVEASLIEARNSQEQREEKKTLVRVKTEKEELQKALQQRKDDHDDQIAKLLDRIDILETQLEDRDAEIYKVSNSNRDLQRSLDEIATPSRGGESSNGGESAADIAIGSDSPIGSPRAAAGQQPEILTTPAGGKSPVSSQLSPGSGPRRVPSPADLPFTMQREIEQQKGMIIALRRELSEATGQVSELRVELAQKEEEISNTPRKQGSSRRIVAPPAAMPKKAHSVGAKSHHHHSTPSKHQHGSSQKSTQSHHHHKQHHPHHHHKKKEEGTSLGEGIATSSSPVASPLVEQLAGDGGKETAPSFASGGRPPSGSGRKTVQIMSPEGADGQQDSSSRRGVSPWTDRPDLKGSPADEALLPATGVELLDSNQDSIPIATSIEDVPDTDTPDIPIHEDQSRSHSVLGGGRGSGSKTPGDGSNRPFVASLQKPSIVPRGLSRNSADQSDRSIKRTHSPPTDSPRVLLRSEESTRKAEERRRLLRAHQSHMAELIAVTEDPHPHLIAAQNRLLQPVGGGAHQAALPLPPTATSRISELSSTNTHLSTHQLEELVAAAQVDIKKAACGGGNPQHTATGVVSTTTGGGGTMNQTSAAKHLQAISEPDVKFYEKSVGCQTDEVTFLEPPPNLKFPPRCFDRSSQKERDGVSSTATGTEEELPEEDFAVVLVCQPFVKALSATRCSVLQAPYLYKEELVTPAGSARARADGATAGGLPPAAATTVLPIPESDTERKRIIQVLNATAQDALKKLRISAGLGSHFPTEIRGEAVAGSRGGGGGGGGGGRRYPSPGKKPQEGIHHATVIPPPVVAPTVVTPHVPTQSAALAKRARQRPQSATTRNPNFAPAPAAETERAADIAATTSRRSPTGGKTSSPPLLPMKHSLSHQSNPYALLKATRPRSAQPVRNGDPTSTTSKASKPVSVPSATHGSIIPGTAPAALKVSVQELLPFN